MAFNTYDSVLISKYASLEADTLTLFKKGQIGGFYAPRKRINLIAKGDSDTENLFDLFGPDAKSIYRTMASVLSHKTPYEDDLEKDTVITAAIDKLKYEIMESVERRDVRPIYFKGGKGCGKTTSLNYLINDFNKAFDTRKTLMIRGCAEEYVAIKKDFQHIDSRQWGVRDYMVCQTVSVFVQYKDLQPFKSILAEIGDRNCGNHRGKGAPQETTVRDQIAYFHKELSEFTDDGFPHPHKIRTYELIKYLSKPEKNFSFINWDYLHRAIDDYFSEENMTTFYVFDGMDNIWSFDDDEIQSFKSTVSDLATELATYSMIDIRNEDIRNFYVIACRSETYAQILQKIKAPKLQGVPCKSRPVTFDVKALEGIITKKFEIVRDKILVLTNAKSVIDDEVSNQAKQLLNVLRGQEFSKISSLLELEFKTNIDSIFSGNIRGYLHNFLGFCMYLTYMNESVKSDKMQSILTQYHIYIRNLFFGGRRYLNTSQEINDTQRKHEIIFPNIFHFHVDKFDDAKEKEGEYKKHWVSLKNPSLLGIYIINFLLENAEGSSRNDVTEEFCDTQGFDPNIVKEFMRRLIQYRLIEPVEPEEDEEDTGITRYKALPSSEIFLALLSSSPDILMFLALDSVLPAQHSSRLFREKSISLEYDEHVEMVVQVVLKFLAYLNALSKHQGGATLFPIEPYMERLNNLLKSCADPIALIESVTLFKPA